MPSSKLPIILASGSASRKQLLDNLQIKYTCHKPGINEQALSHESHPNLALRLAKEKALHSANTLNQPGLYIGSDQVASLTTETGTIQLEKPYTQERAIQQLEACQGQTVTFYTSLCLYNSHTKNTQLDLATYTVKFRQLSRTQLKRYVEIDQPLQCAGSFKMESLGISLFESMHGSDPNSLVGLPLIMLCNFLINEDAYPL